MSISGWIGVDLDGTVAHYESKQFPEIGRPIAPMVARIKAWLAEGVDVRIFTARVCDGDPETVLAIQKWCAEHIGQVLPVTNVKDYAMVELWDDRAVQVIPNTGRTLADELTAVRSALRGKP